MAATLSVASRIDGRSEDRQWLVETNRDNTGDTVKLNWRKPDGTVVTVTGQVFAGDNSKIEWSETANFFQSAGSVLVGYWYLESQVEPVAGGVLHGARVAIPIVEAMSG